MKGRIVLGILMALTIACIGNNLVAAESSSLILNQNYVDSPNFIPLNLNGSGAELEFQMAGIELESVDADGATYKSIKPISSEPEKFGETGEVGLPDLPVYAHLMGIPDQSGVVVDIISSSYEIIDNIDAYPAQTPQVEGSNELLPFVKNEDFYNRDQFYPEQVVELGTPVICRDLRMIQVVVNPVQYNPVTRQLKVYTDIDYNIAFEGIDNRNVKIRRSNYISESFLPLYRSLVPNADEILDAYEPIRGGYLILTPDLFADSAAVLGTWKHRKGYDVHIATASDIDPDGNSPTQADVFNYIQNAYETWEVPPEYVCIIGDESMTINEIPDYPFGGYTSDHNYSCVDGDDFLSDVFVTRLSVDQSLNTLSIAMSKILNYENNPNMTDPSHWRYAFSSAGNIGATTPRITVLWVRELLMENGFDNVDTCFAYGSTNPNPLMNTYFNNGPSIISYRGWGFTDRLGAPTYTISDLNQIPNSNKLGILASLTCGTGDFGSSLCFGEQWIRMGYSNTLYKGGPGFYGSSDHSTHTKWDNPIMFGYYWGIFNENNYHFAAAAFRGKIQLYNTFPRFNGSGGYVEQYFHTFNTLGDPELEIRTAIPQTMTVTHPASLPVGTSIMAVHVDGQGGGPLEGAYVCLVKGTGVNEEVFVGGRTDQSGDITLDFNTTTADDMHVTVTARNYIPYQGVCSVQAVPVAVGVNSVTVDDDNSGNSSGNNDGNCNPSEHVELDVVLKNFGNSTTATNVNATLVSNSDLINVTVASRSYGTIAPGNTATASKFAIAITDHAPQGEHVVLELNVTSDQGNWTSAVPIDIKSMSFIHLATNYPGNSNHRLDPGETSTLVFTLQNEGELAGTSLTGGLTTSDPYVTIVDGTANFGDIGIGQTGSNAGSPFTVQVDFDVANGHNVNFDLELTSSNGSIASRVISAVIGHVNNYDPVGPDDYGYYIYDNSDVGYTPAPAYDWVEISPYIGGPGTRVNFSNSDDASSVISLPFDMVYYGQSFDYMLVCINGFVAFDTTTYDMGGNHWANFHNKQIPDVGAPSGLIAPFWDDLEYTGSGGVFQYYDASSHRFILEWKDCMHPNPSPAHSPETFQMIVLDPNYYPTSSGDAEIIFQYQTVYNDDDDYWDFDRPGLYCTVGMQDLDNNDGLEYTYDNLYHPGAAPLEAGRAIKITTEYGLGIQPDIESTPTSFFINANSGETLLDTLNIANVGDNTLLFDLLVVTDVSILAGVETGAENGTDNVLPEPIGSIFHPEAKAGDRNQPLYPPVILSQGGPDDFGYIWLDSDEPSGPQVNWIDISGVGNPLSFTDDQNQGPFDLGFSMPFYENSFSSIRICSNGWLSFSSSSTSYSNQPIPTSDQPNDLLAPFWDDLNPADGGSIYYYSNNVDTFIVEFDAVPGYGGNGLYTFEAILTSNGNIKYQYLSMVNDLSSSTIGIENSTGTDGLQVVYNSSYIASNMAIKFYRPALWCYTNVSSGTVDPGNDMDVVVTFDATDLDEGVYTGEIVLNTNDHDEPSVYVPMTLTVGPGGVPDIAYDSSPIVDSLEPGQSEYHYLTIHNNGTGNLFVELNATEFNMAGNPSGPEILGGSKEKNGQPPVALNTWLFISPGADTLGPGDSLMATITLDAATLGSGDYIGEIGIVSNDPDTPTGSLPVTLAVLGSGCIYVVGDANYSGSYNGLDVTYSVAFFKGGPPPPYSCECTPGNTWYVSGDVNASCSYNGLDVTYGVAYLKGGPSPMACADCPPAVLTAGRKDMNKSDK